MRINDMLLLIAPAETCGAEERGNLEINRIAFDSRDRKKSSIFFAYKGETYDSNADAVNIYEEGAADFIVAEKYLGPSVPHAVVKNGRKALSETLSAFFDNPLENYKSAAVTGTNGKTTTTYILDSVFRATGGKTVRIGTTGAEVADRPYPLDNTTPSAYDFFSLLAEGVKEGCSYASMEISSHALAQGRVAGAKFNAAVFTNLTGDHMDFHKTMENYFEAKASLFDSCMSEWKVINTGHDYGKRLAERVKSGLVTFSAQGEADIYPVDYKFDVGGIEGVLSVFGRKTDIRSGLTGEYNLENVLGAVGASCALNVPEKVVMEGIAALDSVPGRLERVGGASFTVFVDYAHTDDALKNVLVSLRGLTRGRIITVFGAGGDRDGSKRPRMGKTASSLSDTAIVTSDNPRTEDPDKIIAEIMAGITEKENVVMEPDREKAIEAAVNMASEGDIILIAGKGHENYQIIGKTKYPFDDRLTAEKYIKRAGLC